MIFFSRPFVPIAVTFSLRSPPPIPCKTPSPLDLWAPSPPPGASLPLSLGSFESMFTKSQSPLPPPLLPSPPSLPQVEGFYFPFFIPLFSGWWSSPLPLSPPFFSFLRFPFRVFFDTLLPIDCPQGREMVPLSLHEDLTCFFLDLSPPFPPT